ncbi:MAG: ABC transporter substrate-binding protein [Caldilineaceae bacterium]|nr:ABC transporter substrate-binding protein [Caldilineaceae bacterium]
MSIKSRMDRRTFLKMGAMAVAGAAAAACAGPPASTSEAPAAPVEVAAAPQTGAPAAPPSQYREAPMLAERVAAGQLPPVDQRLPPNPQVITPVQEIGQYGGTLRIAIGNANALFGDGQAVIGTELVLRIAPDFNSITGGLFESWEFNDDATEQILHLRQGLKWSDGQPMTTQDCLFDYVDCKQNSELSPAGPGAAWRAGLDRVPMEMTAVDDYTLKLNFVAPKPLIILDQAFYSGAQYSGMYAPKHYGMQFHPQYADAAKLEQAVKDAGFETWIQLMGAKMRMGSTIPSEVGLPGMTAFIRTADDPSHHTYERNPYYWKVDPEGNQLPYVDTVIINIIADKELLTTRLLSGDLDFSGHSTYLKNMELYNQARNEGRVNIYLWQSTLVSAVLIYPNLTPKDEELREFFQKKNARVALSISIDREEINDVVHFGLGTSRQMALWPSSIYYQEGDESHYIDYNPQQANDLLDQEGYTNRDAQGYRLFPSGRRISWVGEFDPEQGDIPPTLELCIQYWKDIGIEFTIKPLNRQLLTERWTANELPMTFWQGDIGSDIVFPLSPKVMHGNSEPGNALGWSRAWEMWMRNKGQFPDIEEEPPAWVQLQYTDWDQFHSTLDEQERIQIMRGVFDRFYEHLPCFGTVGVPQAVVLKSTITNVPEMGVWGFGTIRAVPVHPEQFFIKQA